MLKTKTFVWQMCVIALALYSAIASADEPVPPARENARIRLFGQNSVGVRYYPNSTCYGGESVTVSGGIGDAFSSFLGTAMNKSIGMPASPNTDNQASRDGLLSKAYFREYEIVPGQPITITMGFHTNQGWRYLYCGKIAGTFIPEKGKDYEGALDINIKDNVCLQVINELQVTPDGTILKPVPLSLAKPCG